MLASCARTARSLGYSSRLGLGSCHAAPKHRTGSSATGSEPGDDGFDDLALLGLVLELVAQARVGASLDPGRGPEDLRRLDRHEAVVLAMEDERRDAETSSRDGDHPILLGETLGGHPGRGRLDARRVVHRLGPHGRIARQRRAVDRVRDVVRGHDARERPARSSASSSGSSSRGPARSGPPGPASVDPRAGSPSRSARRASAHTARRAGRRRRGPPSVVRPGRRGTATSARRRRAGRPSRPCRGGRRPRPRGRPRSSGPRRARIGRSVRRGRAPAAPMPTARRPTHRRPRPHRRASAGRAGRSRRRPARG